MVVVGHFRFELCSGTVGLEFPVMVVVAPLGRREEGGGGGEGEGWGACAFPVKDLEY